MIILERVSAAEMSCVLHPSTSRGSHEILLSPSATPRPLVTPSPTCAYSLPDNPSLLGGALPTTPYGPWLRSAHTGSGPRTVIPLASRATPDTFEPHSKPIIRRGRRNHVRLPSSRCIESARAE
jgi:hypothetical protein